MVKPMEGLPERQTWSALVVDDDGGVRQSLRLCLEAEGARVLGVGTTAAAVETLERTAVDVVFLDLWLKKTSGLAAIPEILRRRPGVGIVVITAFASYETAVEAMKRGAADYLPKPFTPEQVRLAAKRVLEADRLRMRVADLEQLVDEAGANVPFSSKNPGFVALTATLQRAAVADSVILLRGESGTGKNVLARWIRDRSARAHRPFVSVNCPTLSNDLMSSALFGHRKGSFTGAISDAIGKVQEAEGGTLFLDEVGDLSADAQARLLRFLNDRTYERLGDPQERQADVRVIAATNRDIEGDIVSGRFREDLFYRLNVVSLTLPPLRERREDILLLARSYLHEFARKQGREGISFSASAEECLTKHSWPGNLRELRNAVERAVILGPGPRLEVEDLGLSVRGPSVAIGAPITLEELEREHIARVTLQSPTLDAAAKTLGIDATTLSRKRKRYGLA